MEVPITGTPSRVSFATAFLLLSVLVPMPVTARSRSDDVVILTIRSTVRSQ